MNVVVSGGGMIGRAFARFLMQRGVRPTVLDAKPAGPPPRIPFMLGYHGYPALQSLDLLHDVQTSGWNVAPDDGRSIGITIDFGRFVEIVGEGVDVQHEHRIVGLVQKGERVAGVRVETPEGPTTVEADLVVACEGRRSPTRALAGLEAEVTERDEGGLVFVSPAVIDRPFRMTYTSDGRVLILVGWPTGSAGFWTIDKVGQEAALAPGIDVFKRSFAALMPEAAPAVEALTSMDQVQYGEPEVVRCPEWWTPGFALLGDAAHFFSPETGVAAGLSLGDAHALAEAIAQNPTDPDAACAAYAAWRLPIVRPLEDEDPSRNANASPSGVQRRPEEHWPPLEGGRRAS